MRAILPEWDGQPLSIDEAMDRILLFSGQHGEPASLLAARCSVLPRLTFEAVALLRRNFLDAEHHDTPSLDASVLYGGLCMALGGGYFEMDNEVRLHLRMALDRWARTEGDWRPPSQVTARFVRSYVFTLRREDSRLQDSAFQDYLNMLEWVAIGYDEPEYATRLLAEAIQEESQNLSERSTGRVRFSSLPGLLTLPLAGQSALIALAEGVNALKNGDDETAKRLLGSPFGPLVSIDGVDLPKPSELLSKFTGPKQPNMVSGLEVGTPLQGIAPPMEGAEATDEEQAEEELHTIIECARLGLVDRARQLINGSEDIWSIRDSEGFSAIHVAVEHKQHDFVVFCLDAGCPVDQPTKGDTTPLSLAAQQGDLKVMRLLMRRGAIVDRRSQVNQMTALGWASYLGQQHAVKLLIHHGALSKGGSNALFRAALKGRIGTIQLLLDAGASWSEIGFKDWSMLHAAASSGHLATLNLALTRARNIDPVTDAMYTPLHLAALNGHAKAVEALAELGSDLGRQQKDGWSALHLAAQNYGEVVATLLRFGVDPDTRLARDSYAALHIAAHHNCDAAVSLLLAAGADPNALAQGVLPIQTAATKGYPEALSALLNAADTRLDVLDKEGRDLVTIAVKSADAETVMLLWQHPRIDINKTPAADASKAHYLFDIVAKIEDQEALVDCITDPRVSMKPEQWRNLAIQVLSQKTGTRALFASVLDRSDDFLKPDFLEPLVKHASTWAFEEARSRGLSLDRRDSMGRSMLYDTRILQSRSVLEVVLQLERDLNVNMVDKHGITPLMFAAERGFEGTVKALIELGADKEMASEDGWTALHFAAQGKQNKTLELLLEDGADPTRRTLSQKLTPMAVAVEAGAAPALKSFLAAGLPIRSARSDQFGPLALAVMSADIATIRQTVRAALAQGSIDRKDITDALRIVQERLDKYHRIWGKSDPDFSNTRVILSVLHSGKEPPADMLREPRKTDPAPRGKTNIPPRGKS
ncbi:ankyrin repeat domain-containing protein [Roseobacter sp. EG26]|uniref:ankyrin repeat domain-containing protein n=1 Tax=Roseobacter sp. EG26 TaxID=3412477 RepID=UPI003CE4A9F8